MTIMNTRITQEEVQKIKDLAGEGGYNISRIAAIIGRDRSTVAKVVKNNNITLEYLNMQDLNIIKHMIKEKKPLSEIASVVKRDKTILKNILEKQYGIIIDYNKNKGKKFIWGRERLAKLKEMYNSPYCTIRDIAEYFGCSEGPVVQQAKLMGLEKKATHIGRTNTFGVFSEEDQKWIKSYMDSAVSHPNRPVSLFEMAKHLNAPMYSVALYLKKQPYIYQTAEKQLIIPEYDEFQSDFKNPYISHIAMAEKYGVSSATIANARKREFGKDWRLKRDTWVTKSSAEKDFEAILHEMNLAFLFQFNVDKWRFDYNLGFKLLIEVQGTYWHSTTKKKEIDARKKQFAETLGYVVLQIKEEDITKNKDMVKSIIRKNLQQQIIQEFGFPNLVHL